MRKGQTFYFVNFDKAVVIKYDNGHTLLEHSQMLYWKALALKQLVKTIWKGDKVMHVGELAFTEFKNDFLEEDEEYFPTIQEFYEENSLPSVTEKTNIGIEWRPQIFDLPFDVSFKSEDCRYLYNTKRKEYVDSFKMLPFYVSMYDYKISLHKLDAYSLLVARGNELDEGSEGSYSGPDKELVGLWASTSDSIIISEKSPDELATIIPNVKNYTEITPLFCYLNIYKTAKNETIAFQDFLKKANREEVLMCELDTDGVLEPEKLKMLLKQYKEEKV